MNEDQAERADLAYDEFKDQFADDHAPEYDSWEERLGVEVEATGIQG